MKKITLKRFGFRFLVLFLLSFMLLIFGPAEIFLRMRLNLNLCIVNLQDTLQQLQ